MRQVTKGGGRRCWKVDRPLVAFEDIRTFFGSGLCHLLLLPGFNPGGGTAPGASDSTFRTAELFTKSSRSSLAGQVGQPRVVMKPRRCGRPGARLNSAPSPPLFLSALVQDVHDGVDSASASASGRFRDGGNGSASRLHAPPQEDEESLAKTQLANSIFGGGDAAPSAGRAVDESMKQPHKHTHKKGLDSIRLKL